MNTPAYCADHVGPLSKSSYRRARAPLCGGLVARAFLAVSCCLCCLGLLVVCLSGPARAQDAKEPPAPAAAKTPPTPPAPDDVERVTSDGLVVRAVYFASSITERNNAVPIVLLHSWKSDGRKEFEVLAKYLQAEGHAVLVPDLRGHGQSKKFQGTDVPLDPAKLRNADFADMVTKDMEAWRSFLIQENNNGTLNLNKLCLVGSEMGASVALQWALYDWNWLVWSGGKRRPSVKALALLSPQTNFRGLDTREPLANLDVRTRLSIMILVGKQDNRAYTQANQLYTRLEKFHTQPPGGLDEQELAEWDAKNRDLFFRTLDTRLQGSKLLEVPSFRVPERIRVFIEWRLTGAKSKDFPWQEIGKKG